LSQACLFVGWSGQKFLSDDDERFVKSEQDSWTDCRTNTVCNIC